MNRRLKHIILSTLFLAGSAGVWMACEPNEESTEEPVQTEAVESSPYSSPYATSEFISTKEKIDNAKLIAVNYGDVGYNYNSTAGSHTYQMARFETTEGKIDLLIPYSESLEINSRYGLEYETLNPDKPYTAEEFVERFLQKKGWIQVEPMPNNNLSSTLDGILTNLTEYEDLR